MSFFSFLRSLGISRENMRSSFVKNTSWVTGATIINNIFSYVLIVLLTRYLGAEGLGQYSFLFAFSSLFFLFADWGLSPLMVKDLSRNSRNMNKYISNIFSFKIILLFLSLVVFLISIFFIDGRNLFVELIIVGLIQLSMNFASFSRNILRINQNGKSIAKGIFFERLFSFIFGGLSLIFFGSLTFFIVILLFSQLIKLFYYFFSAKKSYVFSPSLNLKFIGNLLKRGYPFLLVSVFTIIYARFDTVMLSFMMGDEVTGWYNAAYKLIDVFSAVPSLLLIFGFPLFSKLKKNKVALRSFLKKILLFCLSFLLPVLFVVFFFSKDIIFLVYGFTAPEIAFSLQLLIFAVIFIITSEILGNCLAAIDNQKIFAVVAGSGAILNIILNMLFIPRYSLYGAAIATLISYVLVTLLFIIILHKKLSD